MYKTKNISISEIEVNKGQIYGLPKNPRFIRDNRFNALKKSIEEAPEMLGLRELLVYPYEGKYVVIGGNMRLRACLDLGYKEVPCKILPVETPVAKLREYTIKDNEGFGQNDWDILANEWDDEELQGWGMELPTDWGDMLSEESEDPENIKEDEAPEIDETKEPICKLGDVWQLGRHRLICGDSTDVNVIDRLMDGGKADMVFTDPPYGMKKESEGVLNDNLNYDDLLDFNRQWIPLTFGALKDNGSWYCWGIDEPLMDIYSNILKPMIKDNKITFRNLLTWDKGDAGAGGVSFMGKDGLRSYPVGSEKCLFVMCGVQGFSNNADNYFEEYEPIRKYLEGEAQKAQIDAKKLKEICGVGMFSHWFTKSQWDLMKEEHYKKIQQYCINNGINAFGVEFGEIKKQYEEIKKQWYDTRAYFDNTHDTMTDVWAMGRISHEEKMQAGGHATPKPIALCSRAIKSSSREGEIVLDVFGGSGSTLIACEQLNRICYMCELAPHYCDVILQRYINFKGSDADVFLLKDGKKIPYSDKVATKPTI